MFVDIARELRNMTENKEHIIKNVKSDPAVLSKSNQGIGKLSTHSGASSSSHLGSERSSKSFHNASSLIQCVDSNFARHACCIINEDTSS